MFAIVIIRESFLAIIAIVVIFASASCQRINGNQNVIEKVFVYKNSVVVTSQIDLSRKAIKLSCCGESTEVTLKKIDKETYTTEKVLHPILEKAKIDWKIDKYTGSIEVPPSPISFESSMTFFDKFGNLISIEKNYLSLFKSEWLKNPISFSEEKSEIPFIPTSYKVYSLNKKYILFLFNKSDFFALLINENGDILEKNSSSFDEDVTESDPEFDPWNGMIYYYREGKGIVDFKSSTFSYDKSPKESNIILVQTSKDKSAAIFVNELYIYQIVGYSGYILLSKLKHDNSNSTIERLFDDGIYIYNSCPLGALLIYRDYVIIPYLSTSDKTIKFYLSKKNGETVGNLTTNFGEVFSLYQDERIYLLTDGIDLLYILSYNKYDQKLVSYRVIKDNNRLEVEISNRKEIAIPEILNINIVNYGESKYLSVTTKKKTYILNFDLTYMQSNSEFEKPIYGFFGDYIIYLSDGKFVAEKQRKINFRTILESRNSYYYEIPPKISRIDYETHPSTGIDLTLRCFDGNYEPLTFNFYIQYVRNGILKEYSTSTVLDCIDKERLQIIIGNFSHLQNDVERVMDSLGQYDEIKDKVYY